MGKGQDLYKKAKTLIPGGTMLLYDATTNQREGLFPSPQPRNNVAPHSRPHASELRHVVHEPILTARNASDLSPPTRPLALLAGANPPAHLPSLASQHPFYNPSLIPEPRRLGSSIRSLKHLLGAPTENA